VTIQRSDLQSSGEATGSPPSPTRPTSLRNRFVTGIQSGAQRAWRWTKREVILVLFAAFIAGLGAGAAEAVVSWALN